MSDFRDEDYRAVIGHIDTTLGFTIPPRHARGRLVRLGPVLDAILSNHDYPPVIERLLAEALTLTALLGTTLKEVGGQLTLQAQSQGGVIDLLVCDYKGGEMRGYVRHDPDRLAEAPADPSLFALFGNGHLAITFDQSLTGERYQGIVPLDGASLAEAAESYFSQSEQIPSLVRLAVASRGAEGHVAGGLLIQHLPEGEEGRDRIHTRLDHPEWGACPYARHHDHRRRADRRRAAAGPDRVAPVQRGGGRCACSRSRRSRAGAAAAWIISATCWGAFRSRNAPTWPSRMGSSASIALFARAVFRSSRHRSAEFCLL